MKSLWNYLLLCQVEFGDDSIREQNLLIALGADPFKYNRTYHTTPLNRAIGHGHYETVLNLLNSKCFDINRDGLSSPFHMACKHNQLDILELLLKYYPEGIVNETIHVHLIYAIAHKNISMIYLLLDHGAVPDRWNNQELLNAVSGDQLEIVQTMLEHGADPNRPVSKTTPLARAINTDALSAIRLLLKNHSIDLKSIQHLTSVSSKALDLICPDLSDDLADNLLVHCCQLGLSRVVKRLIKKYRADTNCARRDGVSVLMMTVEADQLSTVQVLLEYGADIHRETDIGKTVFEFIPEGSDIRWVLRKHLYQDPEIRKTFIAINQLMIRN